MDLARDQVADRRVDRAVAGDLVEAGEARRNDQHGVMSGTATGALVAGVARALVLEGDVLGREPSPEAIEEGLLTRHAPTIPRRPPGAHPGHGTRFA